MEIYVAEGHQEPAAAPWEEELLLRVATEEKPEERLTEETDWRMLYRLSPIRRNLLSWYDFHSADPGEREKAELLELDAGFGELTGLFLEKCGKVASICRTQLMAEVSAARNSCPRLSLYVGSCQSLEIRQLFDYVTLVVEPWTEESGEDSVPLEEKMKYAKEHLRPGGTLVIAAENRYGLSYLNGVRDLKNREVFGSLLEKEDHLRGGISRSSLKRSLTAAGFGSGRFYYPMPDHYLPQTVFSGRRLPKEGELSKMPVYREGRFSFFDEESAWDAVIRDRVFPEFANAFLIFAEKPL